MLDKAETKATSYHEQMRAAENQLEFFKNGLLSIQTNLNAGSDVKSDIERLVTTPYVNQDSTASTDVKTKNAPVTKETNHRLFLAERTITSIVTLIGTIYKLCENEIPKRTQSEILQSAEESQAVSNEYLVCEQQCRELHKWLTFAVEKLRCYTTGAGFNDTDKLAEIKKLLIGGNFVLNNVKEQTGYGCILGGKKYGDPKLKYTLDTNTVISLWKQCGAFDDIDDTTKLRNLEPNDFEHMKRLYNLDFNTLNRNVGKSHREDYQERGLSAAENKELEGIIGPKKMEDLQRQ